MALQLIDLNEDIEYIDIKASRVPSNGISNLKFRPEREYLLCSIISVASLIQKAILFHLSFIKIKLTQCGLDIYIDDTALC